MSPDVDDDKGEKDDGGGEWEHGDLAHLAARSAGSKGARKGCRRPYIVGEQHCGGRRGRGRRKRRSWK